MLEVLQRIFIDFWYYLAPVSRLRRSGATIGRRVFIGHQTYIELENARLLTIEDNATLAAHVKIILHDSSLNNVTGAPIRYGQVKIGKKAYIGANSLILPGTQVGASTIVGANSLVKGTLKPHSVYLGQPARYYCSIKELQKKWQKKHPLLTYKPHRRHVKTGGE